MNHKQEIGVGVFFLTIALLYFLGSFSISSFDPFGNSALSSRSIPQMIGIITAFLSIVHILQHAFALRNAAQAENGRNKEGGFSVEKTQWIMLITILLIAAYIFFFTRLGFLLSTFLFLLAEILLLLPPDKKKRRLPFTFCFSAALPLLLYILFTKALSIFLPQGLFGF